MADRKRADVEFFPTIPATPEQLARILTQTPPKKARDWRYLDRQATTNPASRNK